MAKTYSSRSNARAGARSANMDLTGLALAQDADGRWAWMPVAEAIVAPPAADTALADGGQDADPIADEIAAGTDIAEAEEEEGEAGDRETFVPHPDEVVQQTTADLAAELRAELAADVAETAHAEGIEVRQFGTLDAMVDAVAGEQAQQSEGIEADMTQKAQDATAAMLAEEAAIPAGSAYQISFMIERKTQAQATAAAREFAKKLGFGILVTGPVGGTFAVLPGGKAPKAAKPAAPAAPRGKAADALAMAAQGILPTAPNFTAETHKAGRPKLAKLIAMAEAGDIAGLEAFAINPVSSTPKALARYRDHAVQALKAQAAAA